MISRTCQERRANTVQEVQPSTILQFVISIQSDDDDDALILEGDTFRLLHNPSTSWRFNPAKQDICRQDGAQRNTKEQQHKTKTETQNHAQRTTHNVASSLSRSCDCILFNNTFISSSAPITFGTEYATRDQKQSNPIQSNPMNSKIPPIPKDAAKDFQGKIVIIGAGASGLMAANALKYMGLENYIILEASDRIGGRLKQVEAKTFHDEVPLDIGAEWIHSKDEQIVKDILVFPPDADKDLQPSEFLNYAPNLFFGKSKNKNKLASFLYQETKWKRSTWWNWLHQYVYHHVQDKVKLHSPVNEIALIDDDQVRITTEAGEVYNAAKVICTVPLSILKSDAIQFDPPLPEKKLKAIASVDMPPGFKILFQMKEKFYPDVTVENGLFRQVLDGDDVCAVYDTLYGKEFSASASSQNILGFLAVGPKHAGELSQLDEDELVKAVLSRIDEAFDGAGTKNYINHLVQNWANEPYIHGAYSFPCSSKVTQSLRETVGGRILFAGEHTSTDYRSMVTGAAIEGRRAAIEAISSSL